MTDYSELRRQLHISVVDVRTFSKMCRDYGPARDEYPPVRSLSRNLERAWQRYFTARDALGDAVNSPECRRIIEEGFGILRIPREKWNPKGPSTDGILSRDAVKEVQISHFSGRPGVPFSIDLATTDFRL